MPHDSLIVAGFGLTMRATPASLRAALDAVQAGRPPAQALAAPSDRSAPALALALALGLPLHTVATERLAGVATPTQSPPSIAARGVGSVAEAVALLAAGPGARLLGPRAVSPDRMATCALAVKGPA